MAKNTEIFFTKEPRIKPNEFVLADGITSKIIFEPTQEGVRVEGLIIGSTSSTARVIMLEVLNQTDNQVGYLGHITVPANAGQGTVNIVSGLNRGNLPWLQIDSNGNPYLNMRYQMVLRARLLTALTGAEKITITVLAASFDV